MSTSLGIGVVAGCRFVVCDSFVSLAWTSFKFSLKLSVVLLLMVSAVIELLKIPFSAFIVPLDSIFPLESMDATTAFYSLND